MRIRLLAAGNRPPAWIKSGYEEYISRLRPYCRFELIEIPLPSRGKSLSAQQARRIEGERMLAALGERDRLIALAIEGDAWSTAQLSARLGEWERAGDPLALAIGGPDGLDDALLARAQRRWSLSALTLPHLLVRVIVTEQLYRAHALRDNHPYHR